MAVNYNSAQYAADVQQARLTRWLQKHASVASEPPLIQTSSEPCIEVNLSALPKEKRRPVWDWLQTNMPELAQMISTDPQFLKIKAAFNCAVKVELPTSVCRELGLLR